MSSLQRTNLRRVIIIGAPGSGKSTFAAALAARLNLPLVHLDQLWWEPGWETVTPKVFRQRCQDVIKQEAWAIDGTYSNTFDLRMPAADRIIWFDRSRITCLWRVLKRTLTTYGTVRPDMADGCPERLDWAFLRYVWSFNATHRPRILAALDAYDAHGRTRIIRSDKDAKLVLDELAAD